MPSKGAINEEKSGHDGKPNHRRLVCCKARQLMGQYMREHSALGGHIKASHQARALSVFRRSNNDDLEALLTSINTSLREVADPSSADDRAFYSALMQLQHALTLVLLSPDIQILEDEKDWEKVSAYYHCLDPTVCPSLRYEDINQALFEPFKSTQEVILLTMVQRGCEAADQLLMEHCDQLQPSTWSALFPGAPTFDDETPTKRRLQRLFDYLSEHEHAHTPSFQIAINTLASRLGSNAAFERLHDERLSCQQLLQYAKRGHRPAVWQLIQRSESAEENTEAKRCLVKYYQAGSPDDRYPRAWDTVFAAHWAGLDTFNLDLEADTAKKRHLQDKLTKTTQSFLFMHRDEKTNRSKRERFFKAFIVFDKLNAGSGDTDYRFKDDDTPTPITGAYSQPSHFFMLDQLGNYLHTNSSLSTGERKRWLKMAFELHSDTGLANTPPQTFISLNQRLQQGEMVSLSSAWKYERRKPRDPDKIIRGIHDTKLCFRQIAGKTYLLYVNRGERKKGVEPGYHLYEVTNTARLDDPAFLRQFDESLEAGDYTQDQSHRGGIGRDLGLKKVGYVAKQRQHSENCTLVNAFSSAQAWLIFDELSRMVTERGATVSASDFQRAHRNTEAAYKAFRLHSRVLSTRRLIAVGSHRHANHVGRLAHQQLLQDQIDHVDDKKEKHRSRHTKKFDIAQRKALLQPIADYLLSKEGRKYPNCNKMLRQIVRIIGRNSHSGLLIRMRLDEKLGKPWPTLVVDSRPDDDDHDPSPGAASVTAGS